MRARAMAGLAECALELGEAEVARDRVEELKQRYCRGRAASVLQ